jgi:pantoate--beta-alanine ligase
MEIIHSIDIAQEMSMNLKKRGKKVAFVPTMGALHEGHLSLIKKAKEYGDVVFTSIFVNPTQFGINEDFDAYPRNLERDAKLAEEAGCDLIFAPSINEMYPKNFSTNISIDQITEKFEGAHRPGHFDGVALIVAKLFNAVLADYAIFGQKDYQQTLVVKRLTADLNIPTEIIISPTIREENGLAMSSRNEYLEPETREKSSIIFKALLEAKHVIEQGEKDRKIINAYMIKKIKELPETKIQYCASAVADTLEEPKQFMPGERVVLLIAIHMGTTKLIDNMLVTVPFDGDSEKFIEGNIFN